VPDGPEVLARYDHPHFGRWAAVTTRAAGKGRVTLDGAIPGQELACSLVEWLVPRAVGGWQDLDTSVTVSSATTPDGSTVHVLRNWGWEPAAVAPHPLDDLLRDRHHAAGDAVHLDPWDVRAVRPAAPLSSTPTPKAEE
jgi:beta-galactosidase